MATDMAGGKADTIAVHGPARPAATVAALAVTLVTIRVRREDLPASPLPV